MREGGGRARVREGDVMMEVMWSRAKECEQLMETGKGKKEVLPSYLSKEHSFADTITLAL